MRGGDQQKFSAIQARSSAGRLDALCDRFESALKAGQQPRIEEFVAAIPSSVAEQGVRELLGIELSYHRRSGHDVSLDDCRRRLPQYSAVVEDVFRDLANRFPRLGDYELLDVIGSGGMGTVYCARHLRLGKLVALKVLRAGLEEGRLLLERFKQEMHLIGRLNHPNIVTALDAREENGTLFLVMELVDGASVDRLSAAGPLRIADACEIARQVALGLEHAHEHRLVHRDMKPSNLILSRQGVVKIVDFGFARVNEEQLSRGLTDTGTTMGTLDFIAPEQCEDATHADIRADIYSLGCTLFNLLTGHAPFSGPTYSTAAAKVRAHCVAPPPLTSQVRPEVSAKLSGIVARMMAKQPTKRFSTPGEVAEALAPFAITSDLAKIASSAPIERGNRADTDVLLTSTPQANQVDAETKPIVKVNRRGRKIGKPLLVGSGLLVGLIILAAVLFTLRTKDGNLVVEISQPDAVVQISNEEGKVEITRPGEKGTVSIAVDPGKHRLQVAKDGFQIFTQDFVMVTGGNRLNCREADSAGRSPAGREDRETAGLRDSGFRAMGKGSRRPTGRSAGGSRRQEITGTEPRLRWQADAQDRARRGDGVAIPHGPRDRYFASAGISRAEISGESWQRSREGKAGQSFALGGFEADETRFWRHASLGPVAIEKYETSDALLRSNPSI